MNQRDALLCGICENPDDDAARLVFADWLIDHDDPFWAEFIRVQIDLDRLPGGEDRRVALMERESELWGMIGKRLRSELPEVRGLTWGEFERGFVGWVQVDRLATLRKNREVFLTWAPVRGLCAEGLSPDDLADLGGADDPPGLHHLKLKKCVDRDMLRALADVPLCRRLTGLDLSCNGLSSDAFAVLAESPSFAGLRRLNLSDNYFDRTAERLVRYLADSPVLAGLTNLTLDNCLLYDVDALFLARPKNRMRLERLELHTNEIGPAGLRGFLEGPDRPELIDLSFGTNNLGDEGAYTVATWPGLARVRRLELGGNQISATFVESLAKSGLLEGIDRIHLFGHRGRTEEVIPGRLSLYHNEMTEAGIEAVLRSPHRGRLAYLELWSFYMETTNESGSVPQHLREFFANDPRVC
jgi:uncharacterized protein (TIGR02996 family)